MNSADDMWWPCYNQTDAIPGLATAIMPSPNITKELEIIKELNCAQFSHLFKGTFINKLSPQIRGKINIFLNYRINKFNEKVTFGEVILDAVEYYNVYDKMSTTKTK